MWSFLFFLVVLGLVGTLVVHACSPVSEIPAPRAVRCNGQHYTFPADFFKDHQPLVTKPWVHFELQELLSAVSELLTAKRLVWYATRSTLLGALLVQSVLPWEYKLEFGVEFNPDQHRALVHLRSEFLARGLALTKSPKGYRVHKAAWYKFPYVELCWEQRSGENYTACGPLTELNECSPQRAGKVMTPSVELFPLGTLQFEEVQVPVPREPELCVGRQLGSRALTRAPNQTTSDLQNAWFRSWIPPPW